MVVLHYSGRVGQTFGEKGPGSGDTGAVDPSEVKDKVCPVVKHIPIENVTRWWRRFNLYWRTSAAAAACEW